MAATLQSLLAHHHSPPFIYVHHPHHPPTQLPIPQSANTVILDLVEYHTARYLYSSVISKLGGESSEISTWDAFAVGLGKITEKRKATGRRHTENGHGDHGNLIIVLSHAERLRTVLGGHWTVITRMTELSGISATLVLCSSVPWDEMRPPRGDAPEPINIYLPPVSRQEILNTLLPGSSHPLYPRFLDLLISSLLQVLPSPLLELEYLSESLWPIYTASLPPHLEQTQLNKPYSDPDNPPPPLNITVKLLTDLKHQLAIPLAVAMENLVTRQIGREEFTKSMIPRSGQTGRATIPKLSGLEGEIPLCAKFLLVAGYCASYNPAKSDMRLFGRGTGSDGRRLRGGGNRRAGYGRTRVGKVPQRLLGPKPFPLDRLLALFASLYAEHAPRPPELEPSFGNELLSSEEDEDEGWRPTIAQATARAERVRKKETDMEERWEDEVDHLTMSIRLWSLIPELEAQGLLRRMSPVDRLDNVMLRCEVDYETVKTLAKDLRVTVDEYLYEATF